MAKQVSTNDRRQFIKVCGAASLLLWQNPALSAITSNHRDKKVVWVILRGALDSLHTVVPTFDTELKKLRPKLAASYNKPLLPLDDGYALHPSLVNLYQMYQAKEFSPVVAVGSGYPRRSHFDGQDYLESGKNTIDVDSGWLARAINIKRKKALAIAHSTPITLRGSEKVSTWYPNNLKESPEDIYQSLMGLYDEEPELQQKLMEGMKTKEIANADKMMDKKRGDFKSLATSCARLMTSEQNSDCAMLEMGGWDTHNNQASRLERQLTELDQGLAALKKGLAKTWQDTVVIVATEFGRTARENGTQGTDHGTGSALFVLGGAVNGGKVYGDWPGLKPDQLFKNRDLNPTTNSFAWFANILANHWQFSPQELAQVFPHIKAYNSSIV